MKNYLLAFLYILSMVTISLLTYITLSNTWEVKKDEYDVLNKETAQEYCQRLADGQHSVFQAFKKTGIMCIPIDDLPDISLDKE